MTLFLKRGGVDLLPQPALPWLLEIAKAKQEDQEFWGANGDDTVEVLKMLIEKGGDLLKAVHIETITLICDILIDNGVRGAGFLQQELARA